MADTDAQNWDNYWQGRASESTGNALIEVGIEDNHDLNQFWLEHLKSKPKSTKVIDFACGAGSVLKHADSLGLRNLTGVDISKGALNVLSRNIETATTICAPVNKTGLKDEFFDLAVSQFGIEYAGNHKKLRQTFQEMYRILKPNGEIIVVAHIRDGIIYEGCMNSLNQIQLIEKSRFIPIAKKLILALHMPKDKPRGKNNIQTLMNDLNQSSTPIMEWLKTSNSSKNEFARFTYHLLEGSHKLITKHAAYSRDDALNWLRGIQSEIEAYKGRMMSMTQAALSENDLLKLTQDLSSLHANLTFLPVEEFSFGTSKKTAAWIIQAVKQP